MPKQPRPVVVTGMGVLLPGCRTRERFWEQLATSESQLKFIRDAADDTPIPAGVVDEDVAALIAPFRDRIHAKLGRALQLYLASTLLAVEDAALDFAGLDRERIGIFDGTSRDGFAYWLDRVQEDASGALPIARHDLVPGMPGIGAGLAAALFGVEGPTYTFSGSCCSGAIALGHAYREVQSGEIDVALAGGHDAALSPALWAMYRDAGLLSREREDATRAVRPYGGDTGNAFGEGAVVLVLESREHAERRGARILAELGGYRYGNGGQHPTHVDRTGERPAKLIRALLQSRELAPEDVDFVVGHGNGVAQSDRSEVAYMRSVFGEVPRDVPLLSTKPIYGHTLGASSAVNVAAAVMMVHHADASARGVGLSVSYGIGGNNSAILVRRAHATEAARATSGATEGGWLG